jgi:hypothetical protein
MRIVGAVTVPPRAVLFVPCEVEMAVGDAFITGPSKDEATEALQAGVVVARGLGRVTRVDGRTIAFAHVANPHRKAIQLEAGWQIGWAERNQEPQILAVLGSGEEEYLRRFKCKPPAAVKTGGLTEEELHGLLERSDPELDNDQRRQLAELLRANEDIFKAKLTPPGAALTIPHEIDAQGHAPIKRRKYRTSVQERSVMREETTRLHSAGIVRPSQSLWAFPVVLIPKKDGTLRFCVDYRDLNAVTKKDAYPLPLIDDLLDSVQGLVYQSSMDLVTGYWQVPL